MKRNLYLWELPRAAELLAQLWSGSSRGYLECVAVGAEQPGGDGLVVR